MNASRPKIVKHATGATCQCVYDEGCECCSDTDEQGLLWKPGVIPSWINPAEHEVRS